MLNKVVLVGRLTKDPELKHTNSNNIAVVSFTLAVNRPFSSNQSGQGQNENQQTADFINCIAWRRQAEVIAQYMNKGSLVAVDGRIQTRDYTDTTNTKRYVTEVVCDSVVFLDSKQPQNDNGGSRYQEKPKNDYSQNDNDLPVIEDDLPF